MNNSYKNWFKGGLLSAIAVMGMVACTDDHYDIVVTGETEGKTLWENIQAVTLNLFSLLYSVLW